MRIQEMGPGRWQDVPLHPFRHIYQDLAQLPHFGEL